MFTAENCFLCILKLQWESGGISSTVPPPTALSPPPSGEPGSGPGLHPCGSERKNGDLGCKNVDFEGEMPAKLPKFRASGGLAPQ